MTLPEPQPKSSTRWPAKDHSDPQQVEDRRARVTSDRAVGRDDGGGVGHAGADRQRAWRQRCCLLRVSLRDRSRVFRLRSHGSHHVAPRRHHDGRSRRTRSSTPQTRACSAAAGSTVRSTAPPVPDLLRRVPRAWRLRHRRARRSRAPDGCRSSTSSTPSVRAGAAATAARPSCWAPAITARSRSQPSTAARVSRCPRSQPACTDIRSAGAATVAIGATREALATARRPVVEEARFWLFDERRAPRTFRQRASGEDRRPSSSPAVARRGWDGRRRRSTGTARRSCVAPSGSSAASSTGPSSSCAHGSAAAERCRRTSRSRRTRARRAARCRGSPPASPPIGGRADAIFVSGVDAPLLHPALDRRRRRGAECRRAARRRTARRPRLSPSARRRLPHARGRARCATCSPRTCSARGRCSQRLPRAPPRRGRAARRSRPRRVRPGPGLAAEPQRARASTRLPGHGPRRSSPSSARATSARRRSRRPARARRRSTASRRAIPQEPLVAGDEIASLRGARELAALPPRPVSAAARP